MNILFLTLFFILALFQTSDEEEGTTAFPTINELTETRMDGLDGGFFKYLCEYFLPCVVGKKVWTRG